MLRRRLVLAWLAGGRGGQRGGLLFADAADLGLVALDLRAIGFEEGAVLFRDLVHLLELRLHRRRPVGRRAFPGARRGAAARAAVHRTDAVARMRIGLDQAFDRVLDLSVVRVVVRDGVVHAGARRGI